MPPHVSQATGPSRTVFRVASPAENAPSPRMSTPSAPVAAGPRSDHGMTSLSVIWEAFLIESQPVPPNWVDAPTAMPVNGLRRVGRAVAGGAVAGRVDRGGPAPEDLAPQGRLLAGRVEAVVVGVVAVRVRDHVDPGLVGQEVGELGREVEPEVDVAHRGGLGLRGAADDRAGVGVARGVDVGEGRGPPLMTPWPTTFEAVSVPWPADRRVEVAGPGEQLAGGAGDLEAERLGAARQRASRSSRRRCSRAGRPTCRCSRRR